MTGKIEGRTDGLCTGGNTGQHQDLSNVAVTDATSRPSRTLVLPRHEDDSVREIHQDPYPQRRCCILRVFSSFGIVSVEIYGSQDVRMVPGVISGL